MDGNLNALDAWANQTLVKTKTPKDNPAAREKIFNAAKKAKNYGYDIPDDIANEFYDATALESGRSHYLSDGKTVKTGVKTPNGDFAIGFSQVMGNTAKPYQSKGLDPYKEDDNIIIGLNEFYNGDKADPVGRRLAYVGGKGAAYRQYKRTGEVSEGKLYSYLPNNKETFGDYVRKSGGFNNLDKWADQTLSGGNNSNNEQNLQSWADGILSSQTPASDNNLPSQESLPVQQSDILANLAAQKTDLENQLKAARIPKEKIRIKSALAKLDSSIAQTRSEMPQAAPPIQPNASDDIVLAPQPIVSSPTFPQNVAPVVENTPPVETLGEIPRTENVFPNAPVQPPSTIGDWQMPRQEIAPDVQNIAKKQPARTQQKTAPSVLGDADYQEWLNYKNKFEGANLTDSHEAKARFYNELASNKDFGSNVEVTGELNDPSKSPEQIENDRQTAAAEKFFAAPPSIEAHNDAEILQNGSAGKASIDLSQKPPGENAGRFLLREAIKKVAPNYGLTLDEINRFVTNVPLGSNPYDKLKEEDIPATLEALKERKGSTDVDVYVTNANINSILQQRSGGNESEINPALRNEIDLQEYTLAGGLDRNQENIASFGDEDEAKEQTRREIEQMVKNPSLKDIAEAAATKGFERLRDSAVTPFLALYNAMSEDFQPLSDAEKDAEIEKRINDIPREFGSFGEYRKTQDYVANMSAVEYAPRLLAGFGRGIVNQVVSSSLKGANLVDKLIDFANPISYISDQKDGAVRALNYLPTNLRNLENIFGLIYATAIGKGDEFQAATKSADVDRRLLYTVGDRIEKLLGEDKYVSNKFLYKISQGLGSAGGFMFIGLLAPELSIESAFGELSVTSGVSGALSQAGDAYGEAKQAGLTENQALTVGAANIPLGATEMFGVGSTLSRALSETEKHAFFEFIKENILHESLEEAVQEFFQTTGGKVVMDAMKDRDPSGWKRIQNALARLPKQAANTLVNEVPTAALTGGLFGATVGGATQLATGQSSEQESQESLPNETGQTNNIASETAEEPSSESPIHTSVETTSETSLVGQTVELKNVGTRIVREDRGDKVLVSDENGNHIKLVNKTQITPEEASQSNTASIETNQDLDNWDDGVLANHNAETSSPIRERVRTNIGDLFKAQAEKPKAKLAETVAQSGDFSNSAVTPSGTRVNYRGKVIDDSDILTSFDEGYPAELQPRNTDRIASRAKIAKNAAQLDTTQLDDSPIAGDGAPKVVPVRTIVNGKEVIKYAAVTRNHGIESIRTARKTYPTKGDEYSDFARAKDPQSKAANPIYVHEMDAASVNDLAKFAKDANIGSQRKMSDAEQASADAQSMTSELLSSFTPSEDGSIHRRANEDFIKGFLSKVVDENEHGVMQTENGGLSQTGERRIKNAIFAKAFGESRAGLAAINRMSESTDNTVKNITNGLLAKAGQLATLKEAAKDGTRYADFDIAPDLGKAMEKYAGLKESGGTIDEYIKQGNLFGAETTAFQTRVMQAFDAHKRSPKAIRSILDNYLAAVEAIGDPNQQNLFGQTDKPSVESVFEGAVKSYERNTEARPQTGLFDQNPRRENESGARQTSDAASAQTQPTEAEELGQKRIDASLRRIATSETADHIEHQMRLRGSENKLALLNSIESRTEGDTVKVSLEGSEILRVASALISGEDVHLSNLFSGFYLDRQDVADYSEALNELGTIAAENGADRASIDKLRNDIEQAAAENGTAIIDVYSDSIPHERIHQAADLGSQTNGQSKQYLDRYHAPERIEADGSFQTFRSGLSRLENRNVSTGEAIEEAFAYLGTGEHEQFGLTEAEAVDLLEKIVLSYVEKNGVESLQSFSKTEIEKVYEAIEESKRQNARGEGGSENQSPERSGAGGDGRQARPGGAAKQSAAANSSGQNERVNYFPEKSGTAVERTAQERIEQSGLSAAFAQAVNPNAERNAEHAALQTETINLLNRQAQETGDKAARRAKLDQSLEILLSMPLDGTHASNALDQLAATAGLDADTLTKYIERRRPNGSPPLSETELKPLMNSAAELAALNTRLEALENKIAAAPQETKRALKMAIPSLVRALTGERTEAQKEAEQLNRKRRIIQRQMLNRIKTLESPQAGYAARAARVYKAMLVSAVQTTVNNILTAEGARKIESLSDLTEVAINKTLARLGKEYDYQNKLGSTTRIQDVLALPDRENYTSADVARHFFTDAIFARGLANSVLEEFPAFYEEIFGSYASDIDTVGEKGARSVPDRAMRAVERVAEGANVLNQLQEFLLRSQEFNYALQLRLGQRNLNLADVIKNKQITQKITEADLKFAVNRALRVSFALKPDEQTAFGKIVNAYQAATPAVLSPFLITFPNFMYNATKFVSDYAPVIGLAKAGYKATANKNNSLGQNLKQEINPRVISQQLVGTALYLAALALVRSAGDDDKWYYLKVPGTNHYIDVRGYQPFASFIFLANKTNRLINGKTMFTDREAAVSETLEALTGLSTRNLTENKLASILWRSTLGRTGDGKDWDRVSYLFKQQLGEIGGGFLRPLKTVKDIVAQFDDYEAKIPDTIDRPGSQGLARSLPFANRILQLEPKTDFATGKESSQPAPILKIFGINIVNPDFHKEIPSKALVMLREMTDNYQSEKGVLPESQRKAAVKSSLYRAMREAGDDEEKQKTVNQAIKRAESLGVLEPNELEFMTRQKGLSELENLSKKAKYEQIGRAYNAATDSEKATLEAVIREKAESANKRRDLTAKDVAAIQKFLPDFKIDLKSPLTIYEKIKSSTTDEAVELYQDRESELSDEQKKQFKEFIKQKAENANRAGKLTDLEIETIKRVIPDFKVMKRLPSQFDKLPS